MRKLLTIGLSTLAMASLALGGTAGPATAVVTPTPLADAVCVSLPAQLLAAANTLTSSLVTQTTTTADLLTKITAFGPAQGGFAVAVVDYVKAVDTGVGVAGKTQAVYDTLGVYSEKLAAWSNASNAKQAADKAVVMAGVTNTILNGIGTGLTCPVPVV